MEIVAAWAGMPEFIAWAAMWFAILLLAALGLLFYDRRNGL